MGVIFKTHISLGLKVLKSAKSENEKKLVDFDKKNNAEIIFSSPTHPAIGNVFSNRVFTTQEYLNWLFSTSIFKY